MPLRQPQVPGDAARLEEVSVAAPKPAPSVGPAPAPVAPPAPAKPREPLAAWHDTALREFLAAQWPRLELEVVASTGSTNTDLLERLRLGDTRPRLRVAERQTAGRGRHGRMWRSEAGASLTFSLALPLERNDWSGLSLAVGTALADALDAAHPPRIGLKWPNDLWVLDAPGRGRKLGGVLIETVAPPVLRVAVIGVGLNVRPSASVAGDAGAEGGLATLAELDPSLDPPAAFARVAPALLRAVRRFDAEGFAAFHAAYGRRDGLAGHPVRTTHPQAPAGIAVGVMPHGALVVRTAEGARVEVTSGEVTVRPSAGTLLR